MSNEEVQKRLPKNKVAEAQNSRPTSRRVEEDPEICKQNTELQREISALEEADQKDFSEKTLVKRGILALQIGINLIVTQIKSGKLIFRTGEGAMTALAALIKLQTDLVKLVDSDALGLSDEDLTNELQRIQSAADEVINLAERKRSRDQNKMSG